MQDVPQHPDSRLKHCYTDSKGNHWYEFHSDLEIPFKRFVTAQVQERLMSFGLTQKTLQNIADACMKIASDPTKKPDDLRQSLLTVGANINQRLGYLTGLETYMQMAGVYYLLDGEPVNAIQQGWQQKKFDIWAEDEEVHDFFLSGAFRKIQKSTDILLADIKEYLKIAEVREALIPTLST